MMCTNLQVGEKHLSSSNLWSALGRLQIYWQVESSTYYLHLQGLTASISSRKCLMWDHLLSLILHCQESCARMAWRSSVQRGVCAETLSRCPWRSAMDSATDMEVRTRSSTSVFDGLIVRPGYLLAYCPCSNDVRESESETEADILCKPHHGRIHLL